jgi:CelD/BcsL family acetyltransferase involved in cellulose biosynthesis
MRAFHGTSDLRAVTVWRDGELAGLVPVVPGPWRLRGTTNYETPGFGAVLADDDAGHVLVERVLDARVGTLDLDLLPTPGDGDRGPATGLGSAGSAGLAADLVASAERRGLPVLTCTARQSPYVATVGPWEVYLAGLSKSRRQSLRRLSRRLQDAGKPTLEVYDGRDELARRLREGFRLEARPWKVAQHTAVLSHRSTLDFYTAAARWAAETGILRLAFLLLDDRPIAFSYSLQQTGAFFGLKMGLDDAYLKCAPGLLLTSQILERAFCDSEVTVVEMLGDADPHKLEFATGTREQVRVRVFGPGLPGRAERWATVRASELRETARRRLPEPTRARLLAARSRMRR